MKKLLVVGVISLFLGLASAPSINANVSRDNEPVEITTEICRLSGGKHTVHLTQEEAVEVELLFDEIKNFIFGTNKIFKESYENESFNCLVIGKTTCTNFFFKNIKTVPPMNPRMVFHLLIMKIWVSLINGSQNILTDLLAEMSTFLFVFRWFLYIIGGGFFKPISFAENVYFGFRNFDDEYIPAEGWIRALSSDGITKWDGKLFGRLGGHGFGLVSRFKGIENFYGIKLFTPKGVYFIGIASHIMLGKNPIW
jgi:hypothetical protein